MQNTKVILCMIFSLMLFSTYSHCQIHPPSPTQFRIYQNYPEPFNIHDGTTIPYDIPRKTFIKLWVEDSNKNFISLLVSNENALAGNYMVFFSTSSLTTGLYILKMQADSAGLPIYRDSISMHCQTTTSILEDKWKSNPSEFHLYQNFPNPFNPTTKFSFGLPERGYTKLAIYDVLGREIDVLINAELDAGFHEKMYNASKLTSGIYLYRIKAGHFSQTKKLILLK